MMWKALSQGLGDIKGLMDSESRHCMAQKQTNNPQIASSLIKNPSRQNILPTRKQKKYYSLKSHPVKRW